MKTRVRLIVLLCAMALQFTLVANAQDPTSVEELRQQVERLTAIDNDSKTDPEVRKINGDFLEQRRGQLAVMLREKLIKLQNYQGKVNDLLTSADRQVLAQKAHNLEAEIAELESANPAKRPIGSPVSNQSGSFITASLKSGDSLPETRPDQSRLDTGTVSASRASLLATGSSGATNADSSDVGSASVDRAVQPSPQATQPADFDDWLTKRIDDRIKATAQARIDQRSNVNQTEAPSIGDNSTSLVDQSSASDLLGVALNLAGLGGGTNNSDKDKNSAAITATAYSLYSMFNRQEPLDPSFYNQHRNWRRLSFTLGFEKGQTNAQGQTTSDTTIAGAKYLIFAGRDSSKHQKELGAVYEFLKAAAVNFAQLNKEIRNALLFGDPTLRKKLRVVEEGKLHANNPPAKFNALQKQALKDLVAQPVESWFELKEDDTPDERTARLELKTFLVNKYFTEEGFPLFLAALDDDSLKQIDKFIDARLDAFTNLNDESRRAIESIRRAPQFSLSFQSKLKRLGVDEYTGEAIFDYGVHDRVNLSLNGGYFYKDSKVIGGDLRGANFAGQLQFQVTPETSLVGRSPIYFYLASEGNWQSGASFIYKLQSKVKVPIADGIDFPISLTWANRTDLINEKDVRGQFGFTFDTAKLFRTFLSK